MRKLQHMLLTAIMLILSLTAQAQAKMTVELKNGTNLSFYISEINKISWTEGNDTPSGGDNNPGEQTVTGDATDVTSYSAKVTCYANNILENEATDLKVGIIYTDNGTPSNSNGKRVTVSKSNIGSDGKYTINLTDLKQNTTYQYRSFVYMSGIYFWGEIRNFTTLSQNTAITFYTGNVTNINCYSAKVSAQLIIESSAVYNKLNYGICFGTTAEPTALQKATTKDSSGAYTVALKGLMGNTVYYYRPYAELDGAMYYGPISSFRTLEDNVVETGEIDAWGFVKSKITINGGAYSQLELGVCYSTSTSTPTIEDNTRTTTDVDYDNCYTVNILSEYSTIYYRSYVMIDGSPHYGAVKQCSIMETVVSTSGAVDLGLSVKWAAYNVGASSPGDYGNFYAWGKLENKSPYNWSTYTDSPNRDGKSFTKYDVNKKTQLDLEDDVAHVIWGGTWRMPTADEIDELCTKCRWGWTTYGGHNGYIVVGATGNAIFLPAAGYKQDYSYGAAGVRGDYWSSSLNRSYPSNAQCLDITKNFINISGSMRSIGCSVRPVCP